MDEVEVKTPTGRDSIMEAYRTANPESGEPDDNSLFDFANSRHSELSGRHGELSGANTRLAELVAKDPRLGAALSMVAGDDSKSLPYAMGKVFGKEWSSLEGEALEDFEKGYQENLAQLAESENLRSQATQNIETYNNTLNEYGKENSLSDEQVTEVNSGIMQLADNILMGNIPRELIDLVYKGLNYDRDVQEAADTGFVEGKNEIVEAKMRAKTEPNAIPDFGSGTGAGNPRRVQPRKKGSFYEQFKEEQV